MSSGTAPTSRLHITSLPLEILSLIVKHLDSIVDVLQFEQVNINLPFSGYDVDTRFRSRHAKLLTFLSGIPLTYGKTASEHNVTVTGYGGTATQTFPPPLRSGTLARLVSSCRARTLVRVLTAKSNAKT